MQDSNVPSNKRTLRRNYLSDPVNVYDRPSQAFLGRLVNIHSEGLLIMGNYPFEDGRVYEIELRLPEEVNGKSKVSLGIDCLWTQTEDGNVAYWAGCRIIDISDDAISDINVLIEKFGE